MLRTYRSYGISISGLYCTGQLFIKKKKNNSEINFTLHKIHKIQRKVLILETIQTDHLRGDFKLNSLLEVGVICSNKGVKIPRKVEVICGMVDLPIEMVVVTYGSMEEVANDDEMGVEETCSNMDVVVMEKVEVENYSSK